MSVSENVALIRQYLADLLNTGDIERVPQFFHTECVIHNPTAPGPILGLEAAHGLIVAIKQAFPDFHVTVDDMFGTGDKVCLRATVTGTFDGDFAGIPPTHKHASWTLICIYQIADGRIKELWEEIDLLGGFQRLGVLPPLA